MSSKPNIMYCVKDGQGRFLWHTLEPDARDAIAAHLDGNETGDAFIKQWYEEKRDGYSLAKLEFKEIEMREVRIASGAKEDK